MNIEKIKAAALAATQGEWNNYEALVYLPGNAGGFDIGCSQNAEANAIYIAAANPSTVLQLIERLEAAEKCLFQMQNAAIDLGKKLEAAEKDAAKVAGWQADGESAAIEIREMAKEIK